MSPAPKQGKAAPVSAAVSMNPDDFASGGLMDDFDGRITKARAVPWDYNGSIDHYVLGIALTIEPLEAGEFDPFVQTYSAGDLENFAPSQDGSNPVDLEGISEITEDQEGEYVVRVGKKEQMNNNTNWAHFMQALREAGFDASKITPSLSFVEGVAGHFNRVAQKKRSGIIARPTEGEKKRSSDVLVITELKEVGPAKKAAAAVAAKPVAKAAAPAAKAQAAASTNGAGDLDDALNEVIVAALTDDGLAKAALAKLALQKLPAALKAKGTRRVTETDFLEAGGPEGTAWVYDADAGTIIPIPAE